MHRTPDIHAQDFARVSTGGHKLDRQIDALTAAGCRRIFADKKSGKDTDRPELRAALEFMQPGDTFVVPALDRPSDSLQDLITIVAGLRRRGVGFISLHEALDTTTPGGRLVLHVFAALAEFIRELIVSGTREGLVAACERPHRRPAHRRHARDHPGGPRPAAQPRALHHLHREAPRSQPRNPLQPHPGPPRTPPRAPPCPPTPALPTRWRSTTSSCRHAEQNGPDR